MALSLSQVRALENHIGDYDERETPCLVQTEASRPTSAATYEEALGCTESAYHL